MLATRSQQQQICSYTILVLLIQKTTMLPLVVASRNASRASSTLAIRHYSRSAIVKAEPTLHNATGKWEELKSKRPFDEDDHHVSFCFSSEFQVPS